MSVAERLINIVQRSPSVIQANELLLSEQKINIKGTVGALKSLLLVNFFKKFSRQIFYVCSDLAEAETVKEEVETLLGKAFVSYFPARSINKFALHFSSHLAKTERLSALESLTEGQPKVIVVQSEGLFYDLPVPKSYLFQKISIKVSDDLEFDRLITKLIDLGFTRESRVERSGEMSVRGGIVDVFPFSSDHPFRIEFWGDMIESIRKFDPATQRSLEKINQIQIYLQDFNSSSQGNLSGKPPQKQANLLDYLSSNAVVVLDEPELIRKRVTGEASPSTEYDLDYSDSDSDIKDDSCWKRIIDQVEKFKHVCFVSIGKDYANLINLNAKDPGTFKGNLQLFRQSIDELNREKLKGHTKEPVIFFLCDNRNHATRMEEIFTEEEMMFPNLAVGTLGLHHGFIFPDGNIAIITDHQFYGRTKRLRLPRKSHQGLSQKQLKYLNIGDFVVHVDFGIGVFRGLKKIKVRGNERECLHLEYKDGDNLYVRVERMDRVHKYSSKDGMQATLSKLGSSEWQRLKSRTKKKIKDIAQELIEIYAKRKAQTGLAFTEDTLWQRELEASFPYEDTPDQLKATMDVKNDMESNKPMDRLVCGDVGFGKTEIAVRAAFKAVLNGKQVAMLVPTTILAQQHNVTFAERLEKFPIQVEMLSRFRTKAEQKKIVDKTKNGQVDIVIGTHRILSKDVSFKDLGLLIIDEEQRFGVRHKERLKRLRTNVDVLTLTATPIPRTLYLSLMGARDITNINTAPRNRLPIETEILPLNKPYIREVILREIDRGGQVFFVHNRVRTIDRMATMLSNLIPEAKVVVAHGQMHEKELEHVMIEFMEKKYEILVSTMIIESGLDMPNVNTIIINRADKLGLAQLYQLRGRVGRSHHRAYAYLLIPPIEILTDDALMRLRAIEEFSEIGSGSQLAMRDLEIRGAGNMLGAEQSGFIDTLGFDLYNKILDEAVNELKKEKIPEDEIVSEIETQVEVDTDAYIPDNYIEDSAERVDIYRRLTESTLLDQLDDIRLELTDRFGRLPEPIENLLNFLALRILGKILCLSKIMITEREMVAEFTPNILNINGEPFKNWLGSMVVNAANPFEFVQNENLGLRLLFEPEINNKLFFIRKFLQSLAKRPAKEFYSIR